MDDRQERIIHDILQNHQDNLKDLIKDIYVEKEEKFKQATDDLYSKIAEFEARRSLDRQLDDKYRKTVKKYKKKESGATKKYMNNLYYFNSPFPYFRFHCSFHHRSIDTLDFAFCFSFHW